MIDPVPGLEVTAGTGRAMRVAAVLMMIACSGCAGSLEMGATDPKNTIDAPSNDGAALEILYLLASSTTGVATRPLLAGATYDVVIDGTISLWRSADWSSVCGGVPYSGPRFPSPGPSGPVGVDAEWVWAWPTASSSLCPDGVAAATPPQARRMLLFQASPGVPPASLPAPRQIAMTPHHAYTYSITGAGTPAVFVFDDAPLADNYGALRIRIFAAAPRSESARRHDARQPVRW